MKYIRTAFALAELFLALIMTPKGRTLLDSNLDLIEDAFTEDEKIQKGCAKVREVLALPDDD